MATGAVALSPVRFLKIALCIILISVFLQTKKKVPISDPEIPGRPEKYRTSQLPHRSWISRASVNCVSSFPVLG